MIRTKPGFHSALVSAIDLDAFGADTEAEYRRGIVELIANAFVYSDDGSDDPDQFATYVAWEAEERIRLLAEGLNI